MAVNIFNREGRDKTRRGRCPHLPGGARLRYFRGMQGPVELRSTGQMGDIRPYVVRGTLGDEEFCRRKIFQGAAHTFEQRDVLGARSSPLLPAGEFMKIAGHMTVTDHTFVHRNEEVTGLPGSPFVALYEDTGALHGAWG